MKTTKTLVAGVLLLSAVLMSSCDEIMSRLDNPVSSYLTLENDSVLLIAGKTTTIVPRSINDNGQYTFESSDKSVATVDERGVVTGVGAGDATISVMLAADDYYQEGSALFKVKVYGSVSQFSKHEIGMLVCQDGHIHPVDDAECTQPRIAMLAYVGNESNCTHGLAIALWDAGVGDLDNAIAGAEAWTNDYPVKGGTWRLPSTDDWQYMFIGCGGTTPYIAKLTHDVKVDAQPFFDKLNDAGYTAPEKNFYRTSTADSKNDAKAWEFVINKFQSWQKSYDDYVRYCLAF